MKAAPRATVVVPTWNGADRLARLLDSLAAQTVEAQVIVVDNGSADATPRVVASHGYDSLRLEENRGFSRAVNLGVRRADGDAVVLLNDDCVCDPGFVAAVAAALDAVRGVVMAAGVLSEWANPGLIDTAGMELDATLLPFDYLNGLPMSVLDGPVADPIGPCAAAAAFDRTAFLEAGGFDERLFAYWEDVDLVLRLRREGGRCALAHGARGLHVHSATLGAGSSSKSYLMGFGRAYVLRKWSVLTPRRLPGVVGRELVLASAQIAVDRTAAGVRGRVHGFAAAAAAAREPYPGEVLAPFRTSILSMIRRRIRRRIRGSEARARAAP